MEQFKILTQKELKALSQEETKAYYKKYEDYLKTKMAIELREKAEYEKVQAEKNRKKVNHAMYLVAGELFNSEYVLPFLKDLAAKTRFTSRHTEDLNLLMEAKGYGQVVKFIACQDTKKKKETAEEASGLER